MQTQGKTIFERLRRLKIRTVILIIFLFLLILTGFFSLLKIPQMNHSTVETSELAKDFQSALDAFQKEYGLGFIAQAPLVLFTVMADGYRATVPAFAITQTMGSPLLSRSTQISA